jgi:hypothetical protein
LKRRQAGGEWRMSSSGVRPLVGQRSISFHRYPKKEGKLDTVAVFFNNAIFSFADNFGMMYNASSPKQFFLRLLSASFQGMYRSEVEQP